jgi:hypothetical protein
MSLSATSRHHSDILMGLGIAAWLGLVASGFALWDRYDSTPAVECHSDSPPPSSHAGWELVLFAHPHCPCTRASLNELAELARQARPSPIIRVVFVRPSDAPEGWERSELWHAAAAIPGVLVSCDSGGVEARCAGAKASGHLIVYDPLGRVALYGGITRGRGREGGSSARQAILTLLRGGEPAIRQSPVFGCELLTPGEGVKKVGET